MNSAEPPSQASPAQLRNLHPDCPDWRRLGPTPVQARLRAEAAAVESDAADRESLWARGFTRRRFLAGGLGVGVAAFGSQLLTSRVSYGLPGATGTLVVIFLRGGLDGLSVLVPAGDPDLLKARPSIAVPASSLLPLEAGFGLHPALAPLQPLLRAGRLAAVPAISTPDLSRSHFQAQDCLERGGSSTAALSSGWLDRALEAAGPGSTFRAVGLSDQMPRSLSGRAGALAFESLSALTLDTDAALRPASLEALATLYTGTGDLQNPLNAQAALALAAINSASQIKANQIKAGAGTPAPQSTAATYPDNPFASALRDVATLIKSGSGVRVAAVDLGGWDMHTELGTIAGGDMTNMLTALATALAAFTDDLGEHLSNTTIVTMSEFGRRVEQNASNGLDHGHGGVALVLGGGVAAGVKGLWTGLGATALDSGDVPGSNDYRDLLGELLTKRLGVSPAAMTTIFPGHAVQNLGVMA